MTVSSLKVDIEEAQEGGRKAKPDLYTRFCLFSPKVIQHFVLNLRILLDT